jgi:hypothetical protein
MQQPICRKLELLMILLATICVLTPRAFADTTASYTGTLSSPEDTFTTTLTLTSAESVTLQTYGFGGGTNGNGTVIAPGGTDPFLAIFAGTGSGATILTDGSANPFGTALDLGNYSSFVGCPPANTVSDFGDTTCGDITMTLASLAAGTYTIVLSDGQYIANAVFDNGTLGEGFSDLTGGVFCNTEDTDTGTPCPNTSGAYALDVTTSGSGTGTGPGGGSPTPEPATLFLIAAGLAGIGLRKRLTSQSRPGISRVTYF